MGLRWKDLQSRAAGGGRDIQDVYDSMAPTGGDTGEIERDIQFIPEKNEGII